MDGFDFAAAIQHEYVFEGGKVDDPRDPGGRTYKGVTQAVFSAWLRNNGQKPRDVWTMTQAEADEIYRKQYADAVQFDKLRPGVNLVALDGAIHSGPKQSIKWLQAALKEINLYAGAVDGVIGQATLAALDAVNDDDGFIAVVLQYRMGMLKRLKTWKTYAKGWTSRIAQLLKIAQAWALGSVGPVPVWADGMSAKAPPPAVAPAAGAAQTGTVTGGVGGAISIAAQTVASAQEQLQQFQGVSLVDQTLHYLAIAGAAVALGGIFYATWHTWRTKAAVAVNDATVKAELPVAA